LKRINKEIFAEKRDAREEKKRKENTQEQCE